MCEELTDRGHYVRLFNDPREPNLKFEQAKVSDFPIKDSQRDVLVVFRSPNQKALPATGYKIWWSCDQYTNGSFEKFSKIVDKIVTISPFHHKYFAETYGISKTYVTDLPIRVADYSQDVERIPHRFLFSSVPDRGLDVLWRVWPKIQNEIPDAKLIITSDYRLWGTPAPLNERFRVRWMARTGYEFLGAVTRTRLVLEQLKASVMAYPCTYDELFCIAVAEAQVAGIYPITTDTGALSTTNMGTVVKWNSLDSRGDELFVNTVLSNVNAPDFAERCRKVQERALKRFHPDTIISYWESEILRG
jgi:glycosyltransferase involved in cell wall biosynthesis